MNKKYVLFILILLVGADCLGNGLHYFIAGEPNQNATLRNYAVIGQIIFALAVIGYGFWYYKTSVKKAA